MKRRSGFFVSASREALALLALTLVPAVAAGLFHPKRPAWTLPVPSGAIALAEAKALSPAPLWVDARTETEYRAGHIPGAILLNETLWETQLGEFLSAWTPDRVVVVYCGSETCQASDQVAARLRNDLGSDRIRVLTGGWETWQRASPR